jgi:redox-sensing transcriptional repressor
MRQKKVISDAVIERLPLYYRDLLLLQDAGIDIISSEKLGERLGVTPEQIRKDLTCFGAFGKKGVGYYVSELCQQIVEIIGLQQHWKIGIAGIGHLGWALANYKTFGRLGFRVTGLFDVDHRIIGQNVGGTIVTPISEMKDVIIKEGIQIGVITTPASVAQQIADQMVEAGIKGILSFAPLHLNVPDNIFVFREDLSIGLSRISYYLTNKPESE